MAESKPGDGDIQHLLDAVERIARMAETAFQRRSPFHLGRCGGCDGPSYQQPCPHCSFYPMGDAAQQRAATPRLTAERFRANVERSLPDGRGNLATWYFSNFRRSGHGPHSSYSATVAGLIRDAAAMDGLPDPDEVFEAVTTNGASLARPPAEPGVTLLWSALFEVDSCLVRHDDEEGRAARSSWGGMPVPPPRGLRESVSAAKEATVRAAHGDVDAWDDAVDGIGSAIDTLIATGRGGGSGTSWVAVGNLHSARERLARAAEERPAASPAP